jgi:hypothetical protein
MLGRRGFLGNSTAKAFGHILVDNPITARPVWKSVWMVAARLERLQADAVGRRDTVVRTDPIAPLPYSIGVNISGIAPLDMSCQKVQENSLLETT